MKTMKIKSIKKINSRKYKYDIEVSGTNNFFANDILVHNSSMTVYFRDGEFGVCSRRLNLYETDDNTLWKIVRQLDVEEQMKDFGLNIALQGEVIGEGIQSNKYKLQGHEWHIFDILDIDNFRYVTPDERQDILTYFNLKHVPIIQTDLKVFSEYPTMDFLLKYADGESKLRQGQLREGIVFKSNTENISFKVISNKFLGKYED